MAKRIGEVTREKDLVDAVESARMRRLSLRRGHEKVWWENIALLSGDHYAEWDVSRGKFWEKPRDDGTVRMVLNHALTVSRTELAKLTKQRPIMEVIPSSNESDDIAAARVGRSVLDAAWWKFKLRAKRKQALWWALGCGVGAIYVGWDPYNKDEGQYEFMLDPQTGEAIFDPKRQEELEAAFERGELSELPMERYPLGDLDLKVFSPFQLLPDETCLDFNDLYDLITTEIVDVDVAKDVWGKNAKDLHPERVQLGTVERRLLERAGVSNMQGDQGRVENGVAVHTYWLVPGHYGNSYLKNGAMIRWANKGKILEVSTIQGGKLAYPYSDGRIPFGFFQHIPAHMSIWPESTLQHIRQANLEMDKTASMLLENRNYTVNPIWLVATQHQIKGKIKNVAGSIVRYRHHPNVPPPERVEGTQLPSQVENLMSALRSEILEISGQGETSRGNVPSGVRSGVAVAYLQEEDDTRLGPTVEDFEDGLAQTGSLILSRAGQFYTVERTMRVHRRDQFWDVFRFRGADLKGQTDVVVQAGSALPRHKAAKQQYVLDLAQLGIEKDPKRIREMLELGEGEPDAFDMAAAQAMRENMLMLRGIKSGALPMIDQPAAQPAAPGAPGMPEPTPTGEAPGETEKRPAAVPVFRWHMHDVHLDTHYRLMMSEEYERVVKTDKKYGPMIDRLFNEHVTLHEHEKMLILQQQMMMQAQAQGQGGENGGPPAAPDQMASGPEQEAAAMSEGS